MATALKGAEKDINNATKGVDKFSQGLISAGARLKQIKNELNNFKGSEARFIALNREAAKLTDQIQKTNQRIAVLASSTRNFQAVASAVSGLTGLFTAAQGATAVFGKESEGLQRSLVKLQGSLALLQGVQAAVATVTEQSAAKTVLAEKAQAAYNFVVGNSTGALKGFRIALAATGIGLAVIAIAALVANWDKLKGAITGVSKEQENFNKAREEGFKKYATEATKVDLLIQRYGDVNTTTTERRDILKELNEIAPETFKNLDVEKTKVEDLQKAYAGYVETLAARGTIEVLTDQLSELSVKMLALKDEIKETAAGGSVFSALLGNTKGAKTNTLRELEEQAKAIKAKIAELLPQAGLEALGVDNTPEKVAEKIFPPGTEGAISKRLSEIREKLQATDPESLLFVQLTNQAEILEAHLDAIKTKTEEVKNLSVIEETQIPNELGDDGGLTIRPQIDLSTFDALREELESSGESYAEFAEIIKDNSADISQSMATIFSNFSDLAAEGSRLQISMSIASILAANAEALANAIKSAMALGYPANIPATLQSVALVTSMFAQVKTVMNQAKAAQAAAAASKKIAPNVSAFAEGEVDIHRPGERRGKDSIPAMIMPGESVLTAEKTRIYKPLITAIHEGNIEDLIRVNYIEPALALKALDHSKSDSTQPDYSDKFYRQLLELKEGNGTSKKVASTLARIENKLSMVIPNRYI